jgi:hypothetical protein
MPSAQAEPKGVVMRSVDEVNRLLAEAEQNLATLNGREAELLRQIAQLQEEKVSLIYGRPTALLPAESPVTNQSCPGQKPHPSGNWLGLDL